MTSSFGTTPPLWHGHDAWRVVLPSWDVPTVLQTWAAWRADPQRPHRLHLLAHAAQPPRAEEVLRLAAPEHQSLAQTLSSQCWGLLPGMHRLRLDEGVDQLLLTLCIGDAPDWDALTRTSPTGPCLAPEGERTVTIIGAGLSGAGCARALAERGWQVTVLDRGDAPAAGASGLPVGLVAPHTSPDDSLISRLSRAGVRRMRQAMAQLLQQGEDWAPTGVQERRLPGKTRKGGAPQSWSQEWAHEGQVWTRPADPPSPERALWHSMGAWLRPAQLVRALLDHPNIRWQGNALVDDIRPVDGQWQAWQGETLLSQTTRMVLAAGPATPHLAAACVSDKAALPIRPLRGQVSWGLMADTPAFAQPDAPLPDSPVNGNGCFVHGVPTPEGPGWFAGSTFDRTRDEAIVLEEDHAENFARLQALLPQTAAVLKDAFSPAKTSAAACDKDKSAAVRAWAAVRCSVPDRLPMVGPAPGAADGLWMISAMGSRGLTLALLCAEVLAARWHDEPMPIEPQLARALDSRRF